MSVEFIICISIIIFLASIGTPIGFATITATVAYMTMMDLDIALVAEQALSGTYDNFVILAVPLFITAANIMNSGTISDRLLNFCNALVGRFKGGLGHVNVVISIIFSGMSGSALADASGVGKIIIEMMRKGNRYPAGYAAAITAASSVIGPIIPPSIPMVIYALVSDQSVSYLFLGGIIPGLLIGLCLIVLNAYIAHKRNFPTDKPIPLKEFPRLTFSAFPAILMPVIMLYAIYGGISTPTEAAAIAGVYVLAIAVVVYRSLTLRSLYKTFVVSAKSSASIGIVIATSFILNYIIVSENIPKILAQYIETIEISPFIFLISVNILLLVLGTLLEGTTIILVILPLFLPACEHLGIDLVYFGVLSVINIMIGLVTPPFGLLLFTINAVTDISLGEIIREIFIFIIVLIGFLVVLIAFPGLVLWLPRLFGYTG